MATHVAFTRLVHYSENCLANVGEPGKSCNCISEKGHFSKNGYFCRVLAFAKYACKCSLLSENTSTEIGISKMLSEINFGQNTLFNQTLIQVIFHPFNFYIIKFFSANVNLEL